MINITSKKVREFVTEDGGCVKKTKIVATIGPSTGNLNILEKLIKSGLDVARLNFSHGSYEDHKKNIENIRKAAEKNSKSVGILQDLSGPKIRIGELQESMNLSFGDELFIVKDKNRHSGKQYVVDISFPEIIDELEINQNLSMADGLIRLLVKEKGDDYVKCVVLNGGVLSSRKGVNFPYFDPKISGFTKKDMEDLKFGVENGVDIIAVSFVKNAEDIRVVKNYLKNMGAKQPVFAKIEKQSAVEHIYEILETADGIMVARGDLGVETDMEKVPVIQKQLIKSAIEHGKPVITATQMLTSMINSPIPTRAEVSDVANAILDGTDAVMLSDETTIGKYPEECISTLAKIINETEKIYEFYKKPLRTDEDSAIAYAANILARDIDAKGIVVFTRSGRSAERISRYRPKCPIYVNTMDENVARRLSVNWGLHNCFILREFQNVEDMIVEFLVQAESRRIKKKNDTFVAVFGNSFKRENSTNSIVLI